MKNNEPQNLFFAYGINCARLFAFVITFLISSTVLAEGTPSVSPNSNNITAKFLAPDLLLGSFLNANADNRILFYIGNNTNENLYFGFVFREFSNFGSPAIVNNIYYRIYRFDESVAVNGLWNSTFNSVGSIDNYTEAVNSPNIGGVTNGYAPIVFDITQNGDHWIEFFRSNDEGVTMEISSTIGRAVEVLFDFTVVLNNSPQAKQNDRIFSYKLGFAAVANYDSSLIASSEAELYAYTNDQVIVNVEFDAGFQPIAFNVDVNSYGVTNTCNFLIIDNQHMI